MSDWPSQPGTFNPIRRIAHGLLLILAVLFHSGTEGAGVRMAAASEASALVPTEFTLYVAPQQVDCMGESPMKCLLVSREENGNYFPLYQGIQGFTFEDGYQYKLLVQGRSLVDVPADGPSIIYRLLNIESKTKALDDIEVGLQPLA